MTAIRFRRAREIAGLSIGQAARLLDVSRDWLDSAEHGWTPPGEHLRAMADLYQTTTSWLLGDEPQISGANLALLRDVEHDTDRATLTEFMGMLSTPERDGVPPPRRARTLADVAATLSGPDQTASAPVDRKRRYVQRQGQTREHHCHWPGCTAQVPPAMWGCKPHWFRLPKALRDRIWATYAPGQEIDTTPSREYLQVADDVQRWIRESTTP